MKYRLIERHLRKSWTKQKGRPESGWRGGDPRGGGTRLFDPEVEVEGTSTNCACDPDAPEGVVDELIEEVPVRPFSRNGAKYGIDPPRGI